MILHLGNASNVEDRYEIMAYAAESYSKALGGLVNVGGFVPQNLSGIDSQGNPTQSGGLWLPDSTGHNYADHRWHSAQFRFTIADQWNYWQAVMTQFGLPTNP